MWRSLVAVLILCAPLAARAQTLDESPDCTKLEACVEILREFKIAPPPPPNAVLSSGIDGRPIARAIARLQNFGDVGVRAVLPLLEDDNFNVRNRAGYTLFHFAHIAPGHALQLISADRKGTPWLETPLARTGAEEAMVYLWADFLADPDYGSNSQVFYALPLFGERMFSRLQEALVRRRSSSDVRLCRGVGALLAHYEPFPAFALPLLEAIATSPDASAPVQASAVHQLIAQRHPHGLTALIGALETYTQIVNADRDNVVDDHRNELGMNIDGDVEYLIGDIAAYANGAARAGPLIERFLGKRGLPGARAEAALALGRIGYSAGVAEILAQSGDFDDDWFLAYNAAESLGRLKSGRPTLETLARTHWYKPVRNNAERALNFLDGGAFELADIDGDSAVTPDHMETPLTGAEFRFSGDLLKIPLACTRGEERTYAQYFPDRVRWPKQGEWGETDVQVKLRGPSAAQRRAFRAQYPEIGKDRGTLMFAVELGDNVVAGANGGEWGGAIYAFDGHGGVRKLIEENAIAVFRSKDALFVVTGLSHLMTSHGDLWVITLQGQEPVVSRRIRLPLEPHRFELAFRETLVIGASRGDVAIRADGALIDPRQIESCSLPAPIGG